MQELPLNILPPVVLLLAPAASHFSLVDSGSYPRGGEDTSRGPLNAVLPKTGEATTCESFGCDRCEIGLSYNVRYS